MEFYVKNMTCNGTRFFVLQKPENSGDGFRTVESYEINPAINTPSLDKKMIVKSLQEYGLELKFTESIIKSEIRFRLIGWN
jgi:hypothetical protein